jgi:hypothetical protein
LQKLRPIGLKFDEELWFFVIQTGTGCFSFCSSAFIFSVSQKILVVA